MKVELKDAFLYILGITIMILIYIIAYSKIYGVEGMWNPFSGIIDTINSIIKGINDIIDFVCYMGKVLEWIFATVVCMFAVFSPLYCPLIRIIDMVISLIGFIISSVLNIFRLGFIVDAFNRGVDGIDRVTDEYYGVKIFDWHAMLGVDKKCYWCKFKPFPRRG
jgi:phage-related minor tail protein